MREVDKALEKCVDVLTFFKLSDREFYKTVRPALKSNNFKTKVEALHSVDFNTLKISDDSTERLKILKKNSFHICQTLALLDNTEIYTKEELVTAFPEVKEIICRHPLDSYAILNDKLKELAKRLEAFLAARKVLS